MPTYQPLIPTGTVPLNQDYQNLQDNFNVANSSFGKDHYAFSDATSNNGYHKVVHMVAISTVASNPPNNLPIVPPAGVGLTGELFTTQSDDGINTDEVLWWQSGGGKIAQLTRAFNPIVNTNGATYLPGGIIIQWGYNTTASGGLVTETLPLIFPKNFFSATATLKRNSSNVDSVYVVTAPGVGPVPSLQFRDTSSGNPFFWYAIGN